MRKLKLLVLVCFLLVATGHSAASDAGGVGIASFSQVTATDASGVDLYFFWSQECPHCNKARPFIEKLAATHSWLKLHSIEISKSRENVLLYMKMAEDLGKKATGVPGFLFCNQMLVGYNDENTTGKVLEEQLLACYQKSHIGEDKGSGLEADTSINVPFFGPVKSSSFSLPVLTLVIAGLDAFNPCAFFVLLFLLSLLIHTQSRAKMAFIGGVFVFFSGFIYFLFMAAWLNVFLLIGEMKIVTIIAGVLAIIVALINVKDCFWFKKGVSLSIPESAKPGLYQRIRLLVNATSIPAMTLSTIVLAIVANTYELLCTSGFPLVFTRILTLKNFSMLHYYTYLFFYNVIYVVPLAVIVIVFTVTLGSRKLQEEEGRVLKLLSGVMMLGLGVVLVVAPEKLTNLGVSFGLLAGAIVVSLMGVAAIRIISEK